MYRCYYKLSSNHRGRHQHRHRSSSWSRYKIAIISGMRDAWQGKRMKELKDRDHAVDRYITIAHVSTAIDLSLNKI